MDYCIDCKGKTDRGSKGRCWECHIRNLKIKAATNMIVCIECGESTKHYGKGKCSKCYRKEYQQRPEVKQRHAKQERKRRKEKRETYLISERKRAKTKKRIEWKRKYQKKYYEENKEHLLAYQREYRKDTKRMTTYKMRRRSRERGLLATLTPEDWDRILEEHDYKCHYCNEPHDELEREHRIPASRGGGFTPENIVPACPRCNRSKGDKTEEEFLEYRTSF